MIKLSNRLKHEMAKAFVQAILEASSYRVVNSGMEDIVQDVTHLNHSQYKALALPKIVRAAPDMIVIEKNAGGRHLLDVNYRSWTSPAFLRQLDTKTRLLGELTLVLFNGRTTTVGKSQNLAEVMRCCRLHRSGPNSIVTLTHNLRGQTSVPLTTIKPADLWSRMVPLEVVFNRLGRFDALLEAAVETAARAFAA